MFCEWHSKKYSISGFPDVSVGYIGASKNCKGSSANGGFNPNFGRRKRDRRAGFARLLSEAWNKAKEAANTLSKETQDKPAML